MWHLRRAEVKQVDMIVAHSCSNDHAISQTADDHSKNIIPPMK